MIPPEDDPTWDDEQGAVATDTGAPSKHPAFLTLVRVFLWCALQIFFPASLLICDTIVQILRTGAIDDNWQLLVGPSEILLGSAASAAVQVWTLFVGMRPHGYCRDAAVTWAVLLTVSDLLGAVALARVTLETFPDEHAVVKLITGVLVLCTLVTSGAVSWRRGQSGRRAASPRDGDRRSGRTA